MNDCTNTYRFTPGTPVAVPRPVSLNATFTPSRNNKVLGIVRKSAGLSVTVRIGQGGSSVFGHDEVTIPAMLLSV